MTDLIIKFFQHQRFFIVATLDKNGYPHTSCKGIVDINKNGKVYLLDLYKGKTFENLKGNPYISITAIDEHRFIGYCLKGRARIIKKDKLTSGIVKVWENRITGRITHRLLKNIQGEKGHSLHPEAMLPKPEYLICVDVKEIVDLTPLHISQRQ